MDLANVSGVEGLRWYINHRRAFGVQADILTGLDLGVYDTDLLVRFIRFGRDWPQGVPVDDANLTLAEAFKTAQVLASRHLAWWRGLLAEVGPEIASEAFTSDDEQSMEAIQKAYTLHKVLGEHPGLEKATALALRARGVSPDAWGSWAGISPKKADGSLTLEQARALTDAGWEDGAIVFKSPYRPNEERILTPDPERTLAASQAGYSGAREMSAWAEAIMGKRGRRVHYDTTPDLVDLLIEVRRQVPNKTRLADYRLLGGTHPQKVLSLIHLGCTPDMARQIITEDYALPQGYRTRREPMHDWQAKHYISKALEAQIHERED